MSMLRGAAFSFGCAVLGAAAWTAISLAADMRLGLLGIVVGGLAGFGMGVGSRGRGGIGAGVVAAVMMLLATVASRAYVANVSASRMVSENMMEAEELARQEVTWKVAEEMGREGAEVSDDEGEYTPEVMARAEREWNAMTVEEREFRAREAGEMQQAGAAAATGIITLVTLLVDFGLFGFVFLGLGMATAYKIGASRPASVDGATEAEANVDTGTGEVSVSSSAGALRGFPAIKPEDDEDPLERLKRLRAKQAAQEAAAGGAGGAGGAPVEARRDAA